MQIRLAQTTVVRKNDFPSIRKAAPRAAFRGSRGDETAFEPDRGPLDPAASSHAAEATVAEPRDGHAPRVLPPRPRCRRLMRVVVRPVDGRERPAWLIPVPRPKLNRIASIHQRRQPP